MSAKLESAEDARRETQLERDRQAMLQEPAAVVYRQVRAGLGVSGLLRQMVETIDALYELAPDYVFVFGDDNQLLGLAVRSAATGDVQVAAVDEIQRLREEVAKSAGLGDAGPATEKRVVDSLAAKKGVELPRVISVPDVERVGHETRYSLAGGDSPDATRASDAADADRLIHALDVVLGELEHHCYDAQEGFEILDGGFLAALDSQSEGSWRSRVRRELLDRLQVLPTSDPQGTSQRLTLPIRDGCDCCWQATSGRTGPPVRAWQSGLSGRCTRSGVTAPCRGGTQPVGGFQALDPPAESMPDGPVGVDGWCHMGRVYTGLSPKPHRCVSALFAAKGRSVAFSELAGPVLQNEDSTVTKSQASGWQRAANKFFSTNSLPYHFKITGWTMHLVEKS